MAMCGPQGAPGNRAPKRIPHSWNSRNMVTVDVFWVLGAAAAAVPEIETEPSRGASRHLTRSLSISLRDTLCTRNKTEAFSVGGEREVRCAVFKVDPNVPA